MELGRNTNYNLVYGSEILYPIDRKIITPSFGYDIWTCYELSWLSLYGKPEVAILTLYIPSNSLCIVESKSLKLYLNSFNNQKIHSKLELYKKIQTDLELICKSPIEMAIDNIDEFSKGLNTCFTGICLDDLEIKYSECEPKKQILSATSIEAEEELYTHLFRANCPVTNQPDYASIHITYKAENKIDRFSLLKYFVSYRNHASFHEQCIDQIFYDLVELLRPTLLIVNGRFNRRGGIDINPIRSNIFLPKHLTSNVPLIRQ